ncbi:hypothetical protein VTI74DRAFT_5424 [Chaetomium olivicolor]
MISQDRHEIYIIIGEYGKKYEEYIRGGVADRGSSANIDAALGSPTYLKKMRSFPEPVEFEEWSSREKGYLSKLKPAGGQGPASSRPGPQRQTRSTANPQGLPLPGVDGFLVMHRFGPYLTNRHDHMALLIRRLVALMLELRGSRKLAFPEPIGSRFLAQDDGPKPRSRTWPRREVPELQEWENYRQHHVGKQLFRAAPNPNSKLQANGPRPKGT